MAQEYLILDNYSYSYKVIVGLGQQIKVHKLDYGVESNLITDYTLGQLVLDTQVSKVFVGKSPLIPMTEFSGGHGPEFDGNTLLLQKSEYEYIWIGDAIVSFVSYFPIVEYISPVGNNQVPYPWAIDEKGWVYLFLENVVITNIPKSELSDPYEYWYEKLSIICNGMSYLNTNPVETFDSISKFFIGDEQYALTWNAFPDKEFDRLFERYSSELYVEKTSGIKYKLDKQSYIKLMKDFAERAGICVLDHVVVIDK